MDYIIEATFLEEKVRRADLIITGEGKIDLQTLAGKVVMEIGKLGLKHQKKVVAIAGKSEKLKKRLEEIARSAGTLPSGASRLVPVGFTTQMDRFMAAADLLVGKAGGLTTSEALARHLPMALIEPIPGQEFRNADHLLEEGAAIRCNNLPAAAWKISKLLDNSKRMEDMRRAAMRMAHPNAARDIAEDALRLLH